MISGLTITSEYGDSLSLSMPRAGDGYLVKEIEGLDPVPVAIVSSPISTIDGEVYQASKREQRNIVLHIKLDKNYAATTITQRKNRLYSLAMGKQLLTLVFETEEHGDVSIQGRIENFDAPTYTDNPVVVMSILCANPDFKSIDVETFENEVSDEVQTIDYLGTIPTGIAVELFLPTVDVPGIRMEFVHRQTNRIVGYFENANTFQASSVDWWYLNSVPLNKGFQNPNSGSWLLYSVSTDTLVWPMFIQGDIDFTISAMAAWAGSMDYTIHWNTLYGAI